MKFLRALALRCPWCGKGPVLASWFRLRERCGACGLRLERGERSDDWIANAGHVDGLEETRWALRLAVRLHK